MPRTGATLPFRQVAEGSRGELPPASAVQIDVKAAMSTFRQKLAGCVLVALAGPSPAAAPTGGADPIIFGKPPGGLAVALTLGRTEHCPGEIGRLRGYFKNLGGRQTLVRHYRTDPRYYLWPPGELHVTAPDGREYVFNPGKTTGGSVFLRPGETKLMRAIDLRLTDLDGWQASGAKTPGTLTFRKPGTYRVWFQHGPPKGWDSHKDAWSRTVKSNVVTFTIRELPPAKRRQVPTVQQWADLALYLRGGGPRKSTDARDRLGQALLWAENEGLAAEILKLLAAKERTFRGQRIR